MAALRGMKDAAAVDKREAITKQLEELQDKMPRPLPGVQTVADMPEKRSPINLLARGDYAAKGDRVACARLGCSCRKASPNSGEHRTSARGLAKWIVDPKTR